MKVHLGVDEKSNKFKLEVCDIIEDVIQQQITIKLKKNGCPLLQQVAINEATFRIPDDDDWQPKEEPIDARESMTAIQSTRIDVQGLAGECLVLSRCSALQTCIFTPGVFGINALQ